MTNTHLNCWRQNPLARTGFFLQYPISFFPFLSTTPESSFPRTPPFRSARHPDPLRFHSVPFHGLFEYSLRCRALAPASRSLIMSASWFHHELSELLVATSCSRKSAPISPRNHCCLCFSCKNKACSPNLLTAVEAPLTVFVTAVFHH